MTCNNQSQSKFSDALNDCHIHKHILLCKTKLLHHSTPTMQY